jgi:Lrp/AsnC family leucine-responsive transcriptional regulator
VSAEAQLDAIDRRILSALQADGRMTYDDLASKVGLSGSAALRRVRRLEEAGVITGYHAELSAGKVGLPLCAFIRMSIFGEAKYGGGMIHLVQQRTEVLECHRVTGGDSYILKVAVSSVEHLEELIDHLTTCGQPTTSIVLSSPLTHRVIGPPKASEA